MLLVLLVSALAGLLIAVLLVGPAAVRLWGLTALAQLLAWWADRQMKRIAAGRPATRSRWLDRFLAPPS